MTTAELSESSEEGDAGHDDNSFEVVSHPLRTWLTSSAMLVLLVDRFWCKDQKPSIFRSRVTLGEADFAC
jgi:hypothetical protein